MSRLWAVPIPRQREALDLARKIMVDFGFVPNIRERGIASWQRKENSTHSCQISFRSFRGLYFTGYIGVNFCDCEERKRVFRDIINIFEREMMRREWLETLEGYLFNILGSRSS